MSSLPVLFVAVGRGFAAVVVVVFGVFAGLVLLVVVLMADVPVEAACFVVAPVDGLTAVVVFAGFVLPDAVVGLVLLPVAGLVVDAAGFVVLPVAAGFVPADVPEGLGVVTAGLAVLVAAGFVTVAGLVGACVVVTGLAVAVAGFVAVRTGVVTIVESIITAGAPVGV